MCLEYDNEKELKTIIANLDSRIDCDLICCSNVAKEIFNYLKEEVIDGIRSEWGIVEFDGEDEDIVLKNIEFEIEQNKIIIISKFYNKGKELYFIESDFRNDKQIQIESECLFIEDNYIISKLDFSKIYSSEVRVIL